MTEEYRYKEGDTFNLSSHDVEGIFKVGKRETFGFTDGYGKHHTVQAYSVRGRFKDSSENSTFTIWDSPKLKIILADDDEFNAGAIPDRLRPRNSGLIQRPDSSGAVLYATGGGDDVFKARLVENGLVKGRRGGTVRFEPSYVSFTL